MSKFDKRGVIISVLNSDILMKGEMKMKDCIFCNIANGEIPSATLYEDNGEAAGQTVFHFHMHLIPRNQGDHAGITWNAGTLTSEDRDEILTKFSME